MSRRDIKAGAGYEEELYRQTHPYEQWIPEHEPGGTEGMELPESVALLPMEEGLPEKLPEAEYLVFHKAGSVAVPAMKELADIFMSRPSVHIIYGDEDVLRGDSRSDPWFKPDWSPESHASLPYFGGLIALRKKALEERPELLSEKKDIEELTEELLKSGAEVFHMDRILFHAGEPPQDKEVRHPLGTFPGGKEVTVSVIIPSKDHPELLERVLGSLKRLTDYPSCEILVVDNGSGEDKRQQIEELRRKYLFDYIYEKEDFNFSRMCNRGARAARGGVLLFLNDDIEIIRPDWMRILAATAMQEYAGAVGAKLYYPYGEGETPRIQHAGISNIALGPVHKLGGLPDDRSYYHGINLADRNVLAVTAACMAIEKERFFAVGGFDETLAVAYNDVELCFSLYEKGYRNIQRNDAVLIHHESASRGEDSSPERKARQQREWISLYTKHKELYARDPYYSPHLVQERLDVEYHVNAPCEYEKRGKESVIGGPEPFRKKPAGKLAKKLRLASNILAHTDGARRLLYFDEDGVMKAQWVIEGWAAPERESAGACVTELILKREDGEAYRVSTFRKYRPDVAAILPRQKEGELSGFVARLPEGAVPDGRYRAELLISRGRNKQVLRCGVSISFESGYAPRLEEEQNG
ncbi:MAG: glycosyltransferase [Lachnospiraceae bacterium]|nr:glycosyltransferase [Lachnospiraceae bacterium]